MLLWYSFGFQDARYYERKSSELSETSEKLAGRRDQLEFELRKVREQKDEYKKQVNHMEQALEKVLIVNDCFLKVLIVLINY